MQQVWYRNAYRLFIGKPEGKCHVEGLYVDTNNIKVHIKYDERFGPIWLKAWISSSFL
jgi:hypothetical protein